jgi:hypothetical protein
MMKRSLIISIFASAIIAAPVYSYIDTKNALEEFDYYPVKKLHLPNESRAVIISVMKQLDSAIHEYYTFIEKHRINTSDEADIQGNENYYNLMVSIGKAYNFQAMNDAIKTLEEPLVATEMLKYSNQFSKDFYLFVEGQKYIARGGSEKDDNYKAKSLLSSQYSNNFVDINSINQTCTGCHQAFRQEAINGRLTKKLSR